MKTSQNCHFLGLIFGVFCVCMLAGQTPASESRTSTVLIRVHGAHSHRGVMRLVLYHDHAIYVERQAQIDETSLSAVFVLDSLPQGNYSAYVYHDQNNNGKMDTNLFGIPTERYGASNNPPKRAGRPSLEETRFPVNDREIAIDIQLISW